MRRVSLMIAAAALALAPVWGFAQEGGKPGGAGMTPIPADLGDDSCRWANDLECDDIRYGGTGACPMGTDATDCRALAIGGDNSCQWAFDGECDEPGIGLGVCTSGTDTADCAAMAHLRNRDNSCATAFNDICEEAAMGGSGMCVAGTDTVDCFGRETPEGLRDHYFGHDDRELVDVAAYPWRAIGQIDFASGGACTGALVAPNIVLTAAHCFLSGPEGAEDAPVGFYAGQNANSWQAEARIVAYDFNRSYRSEDPGLGAGNGLDYGFIALDRPIGQDLGWFDVLAVAPEDQRQAENGEWLPLNQAGYSWDSGNRLSGHIGCEIVRFFDDNTIFHTCDTTRGDSGSPIFVEPDEGRPAIIAVDSQFYHTEEESRTSHLAVDARAFEVPLAAFIARFAAGAEQPWGKPSAP